MQTVINQLNALNGGGNVSSTTQGPPSANRVMWIRKGIGQTNVSGLTNWADQSGNGFDLDTVTGAKGTINGDGTVTWAADGSIVRTGMVDLVTGTGYVRFKVVSRDATDLRSICAFSNNTSTAVVGYRATGVANAQVLLGASAAAAYPPGGTPPDTPDLVGLWLSLAWRANGASSLGQISGGAQSGTFNSTNFRDAIRLASNHNDTLRGNVMIAELLIYSSVHDDATMNTVLTYMDSVGP